MTPEAFAATVGIDQGTLDRFRIYAELLTKWQRAINLIGPKTLPDLWHRHFYDSAQLWPLCPAGARVFIDLGAGAGFPGLVLALMGAPNVHLIESDAKKAAFLAEVARATKAPVTVHRARAETLTEPVADVITARALAPLADLLALARPFCKPGTVMLFPKGRDARTEATAANCAPDYIPSTTDPDATILRLIA